MTNLRIKYNC